MNQLERVQRKFLSFGAYLLNIEHRPHVYDKVIDRLGSGAPAENQISGCKIKCMLYIHILHRYLQQHYVILVELR